jgi:hypothetical protein
MRLTAISRRVGVSPAGASLQLVDSPLWLMNVPKRAVNFQRPILLDSTRGRQSVGTRVRVSNLGLLQPPAETGGGTTLLDLAKTALATGASIYFAKRGIKPEQVAPQVRVQVAPDIETQKQLERAVNIGRLAAIAIPVAIGGALLLFARRR